MRLGMLAAMVIILAICVIMLGVAQLNPSHDLSVAAIVGAALVVLVVVAVDSQRR